MFQFHDLNSILILFRELTVVTVSLLHTELTSILFLVPDLSFIISVPALTNRKITATNITSSATAGKSETQFS